MSFGLSRRIKLAAASVLLMALPVLADPVTVGGETVMRLPDAEANIVQQRIDNLLQNGADPEGILAKKTANGYGVFWGDKLLVEVDKALAKENKSTPEGLAIVWAKRLFELVGPGLLKVTPRTVLLPLGEKAVLELGGIAEGPVSIEGGSGVVQSTVEGGVMVNLLGDGHGSGRPHGLEKVLENKSGAADLAGVKMDKAD